MIQKEITLKSYHENELLKAINLVSKNTTILVDFDETLFFYNSTAEYLNNLRPRLLGAFLLRAIAFIKPWQWLTKHPVQKQSRDWFLVFITTLLMPWNLFLWSIKAKELARQQSNYGLIKRLNNSSSDRVIIASLGFNFIIKPILKWMPIDSKNLIACRFWQGLPDRQKGKLAMVKELMGNKEISSSMLITDSRDDLPLLKKVALPFFVIWKRSQYNSPMSDLYFPTIYLDKVKRVGEKYISRAILFDDLPVLLLAFSWSSSQGILNCLSIFCLLFSFWCIYEYGYYENDLVAEKYELSPTLSTNYHSVKVIMNWWQPWIWSFILGSLGIFALGCSEQISVSEIFYSTDINQEFIARFIVLFSTWNVFLLVSRLCFWVYNYANKQTRIWLYFILQICRYGIFLTVMKTNIIGISLLLAHILSRSISYTVYRYTGGGKVNWPKLQEKFLRCLMFVLFIVSFAVAEANVSLLFNWQTIIIFGWCLLRGSQHIRQIINNIGLIHHDKLANLE